MEISMPKISVKYPIITLCGSTKFKNEFIEAYERLSIDGFIVLMPSIFNQTDNKYIIDQEMKERLSSMHRQRIDISHAIYVINKNNYIGESTKSEIEYAKSKNKSIFYMY